MFQPVVAVAAVVQEEDPVARRYPSSRSTTRTAATATTNSATKQEMVSVRRKRVISKVRSGPLSFPNNDIPSSFSSRSVGAMSRCYEFLSIIAFDLESCCLTMELVNAISLQLLTSSFHLQLGNGLAGFVKG